MNAEAIATALGGRKTGRCWMARCPAHEDRKPSLSMADGKSGTVLIRCHAGCDQRDVIAALCALGVWGSRAPQANAFRRRSDGGGSGNTDPDEAQRTKAALSIWRETQPLEGTLGQIYLRSRGLILAPASVRFHGGLKHPSGGVYPAMVGLVTRGTNAAPIAIHRTFLACKGEGKAPIDQPKMMLGPCRGGVVRLGAPIKVLMTGEGIETCLAAMQATGHAAWAALSTSGLRALDLPVEARDLIVLADGDDPGEAAALDCARRWKREGRRVRIARPPRGTDFNDLLKACAPSFEEEAQ